MLNKKRTHGGTRTHNPQIRSLMLYPLSHAGGILNWLWAIGLVV
jgi:hypothetical protein